MPQLPIHVRAGEEPPNEGRQGLLEALTGWSPPTTASDTSSGMKLTVKNTFIDVSSPEDTPSGDMHVRGAMTCQARLSDPQPTYFNGDQVASFGAEDLETSTRSQLPGIPEAVGMSPHAASSVGSGVQSVSLLSEDSDLRYTVKNTFIDVEVGGATPVSSVTQSCTARLGGATPQHLPAPPAYVAPAAFQEEVTSPPPSVPPRAEACRQVLFEDFGNLGSSPSDSSTAPSPYPDKAGDMQLIVKNTFIDIGGGSSAYDDRYTMSCTARLGGTPAPFPSPAGGRSPGAIGAGAPSASAQAAPPPAAAGKLPSVGAELHGTIGEDGQPACQPCAWFYKEAGCLNAEDCRYCHLCPQGELKSRKKAKIARLRNQEAQANGSAHAASVAVYKVLAAAPAAQWG